MILTIDSPVFVRIHPAQGERNASVSLDLLGGSLWFPRPACPATLSEGIHAGAEVGVALRNVRVGDNTRTFFAPVRLVSVK